MSDQQNVYLQNKRLYSLYNQHHDLNFNQDGGVKTKASDIKSDQDNVEYFCV